MPEPLAGPSHPLFSRAWAFVMRRLEPQQLREGREQLVAGLAGTVVEVGAGSGSMFPHYPREVARVIAVEPEPYLREQAIAAAADAAVAIEVVDGMADALPLGDGEADAVVVSLVLCSVPDQAAALAEARRVLRPGGELRYYEHVAEPRGTRARRYQELVDRSGLWARAGGGCRVARETGDAIRAAGFVVEREDEVMFGPRGTPVRRHLAGAAVRP
ncbi:MAG: methyltransferase domain-containing protein [Solirubrobacteraceae bacterium]|nr:methyltransferase domain-containing protein [Solirubrobacteraceae bacterium]